MQKVDDTGQKLGSKKREREKIILISLFLTDLIYNCFSYNSKNLLDDCSMWLSEINETVSQRIKRRNWQYSVIKYLFVNIKYYL